MWNLSALADKAKEAAARIERQLDDSVGLKDAIVGGGAAAASAAASSAAAADDFSDDDDFFSDNTDAVTAAAHQTEEAWQPPPAAPEEDAKPVATKLDASADDGDDFFGEEGAAAPPDPQRSESGEEEVNFGEDGDPDGGGADDGWDDPDEIPLDDDDDDDDDVPGHQGREHQALDVIPGTESRLGQEEGRKTADSNEPSDAAPNAPCSSGIGNGGIAEGRYEMEAGGTIETTPSEADTEPTENNHAEIVTDAGALGEMDNDPNTQGDPAGYERQVPTPLPADSVPESQPHTNAPSVDDTETRQYLATIAELESQLLQREDQLASKADQLASLALQHEADAAQLRRSVAETKEEARKRVVRAKDRVDEVQAQLVAANRRADAAGGSSQEQSGLVAALRAEGEGLARKQSAMERRVRDAKGEARELSEGLDKEREAREQAEARAKAAEEEVRTLREGLAAARKGESRSEKLEGELVAAKEESEKRRAAQLGLDQQLKELKDENRALKKEAEEARTGAALELAGESSKLRKERDAMLGDLESKLRTGDREANVREDALRHEVSELRKRWQDAVRRAEDLSMDVQHSTAPLLRQLESTERQNRSRAAAWAEIETKLRADLEEHVIRTEQLAKERNDLIASGKRARRLAKEQEEEVAASQDTADALATTVEQLEVKVDDLEEEGRGTKQKLVVAERKAAEGASKIRSEMLQTVVDSEQRYQSQMEALEADLNEERDRRENLEKQLDDLAASVEAAEFAQNGGMGGRGQLAPAKEKKLRSATGQASILHDTLVGIDSDDDEDDDGDADGMNDGRGSFAAMEQLSLGLKGAKVELAALRQQLASSEATRESLLAELGGARQAVEKLPLFEQKVSDLTLEVNLKEMELRGLEEDIADVRSMYRTQLDVLLEEKAAAPSPPPVLPAEPDEGPEGAGSSLSLST